MDARIHAGADRGHRLRLGEDLRIRADADLQILAPRILLDQHLLQMCRLRRPGLQLAQGRRRPAGSPRRGSPRRRSGRRARAPRSRARSSTPRRSRPAALIACRSIGASSHGLPRSRPSAGVLASTSSSLPIALAALRRADDRRVGRLAQIAHGRESCGYIQQLAVAHRDDGRAAGIRQPHPPRQRRLCASSGSTGSNASRNAVMPVLPNPRPAPYTMANHEPRRQAHAAVRLVARSGHRDVSPSPTPTRSGARSCRRWFHHRGLRRPPGGPTW